MSARSMRRKAQRAKEKAAKKLWTPIVMRKHKLQSEGKLVTYHVTKPETVSDHLTVEDFGEAGLLVY